MYEAPQLGLEHVQAAMSAMLEHALKEPKGPVAIAIVDSQGNLLAFARMDGCRPIPRKMAIKKAYTCAVTGADSLAFAERLKAQGRSVAEMGDQNLAAMQGGVVVASPGDGAVLGGIGVSGLAAPEDEDIARIGLGALGL